MSTMTAKFEPPSPISGPVSCPPADAGHKPANTYGQILKSSVLIGGSSVFTIFFGIVRTKALALILGPSGVGVYGLFMSIYELARNVAVMGLNSSGVRQIAEATSTGDTKHVALTVTTLRRIAVFFGAMGAVLLAALCLPVAWLSFENTGYAIGVAVLALAVFFGAMSASQIALLQGMRQIADLARANVFGALFGTIASIPVVYFLGERGIAASLVCLAFGTMLASWWYSRRIKVEQATMPLRQVFQEASGLLKLGFVFMTTGLMTYGVNYLIRIIVFGELGKEATGFYQSAWMLGGLYVGVVLQAMGADFFPRLTTVAKDNVQCNRLVNEQAETSLLLAGPGIIGTLTFATLVINVFYSAKFGPAVEVLRWFCLGMMMRVASWPMGFILLAKGARHAFFWTELAASSIQLGMAWVCVLKFGLEGAGIAFFFSCLLYWVLIFAVVRSVSGFRWSAENKRVGIFYAVLIAAVFVAPDYLNSTVVMVCGAIITLIAVIHSVKKICALVPFERFPKPAQRLLSFVGLAPASSRPAGA